MNIRKHLLESNTISKEDLKRIIEELSSMEQQLLQRFVLNREATNYNTTWNADYFYGSLKDTAKEQSKLLVNYLIKMEKIQKKLGIKGRIKDDSLADYFLGNKDRKSYFSDIHKSVSSVNESEQKDLNRHIKEKLKKDNNEEFFGVDISDEINSVEWFNGIKINECKYIFGYNAFSINKSFLSTFLLDNKIIDALDEIEKELLTIVKDKIKTNKGLFKRPYLG